ncbi:aldo/keto reductase [Fluviispira multicolorata]|uniref:Aldo/keto reductase n=1 Tax=Fluviispira multicolorata TaxID=2654512 RepID=A0A833JDR7_9BACT|nr:aldo/keto reductase [Fluviispira multicolorata]KAB8029055.1 aldo/keto reductase [Fluviispira multicolorata]
MEYKQFGNSGLIVPALSFGTATFGGTSEFFKTWGETDTKEASRLIDICLEYGVNFFDTADVYSNGDAEKVLGTALKGKRDKTLISTKATFAMGQNPNDVGSSRHHLINACENSLKRLGTDYIDVYFMHSFDALTPIEETLSTLDCLIKSGKIRYIGCSNFSGWQVMKSLGTSEKYGLGRYVVYQGYYSLIGREYEWDLMPLNLDQKLGLMVWSPLGWGRLTGKILRGKELPEGRIQKGGSINGPEISDEYLYNIVDVLDEIAKETGKSVPQVAINWLLQRPTVCNVVLGARNEEQLIHNLGAVGWKLNQNQILRLEKVSKQKPIYPYWHQMQFNERNPKPVKW